MSVRGGAGNYVSVPWYDSASLMFPDVRLVAGLTHSSSGDLAWAIEQIANCNGGKFFIPLHRYLPSRGDVDQLLWLGVYGFPNMDVDSWSP